MGKQVPHLFHRRLLSTDGLGSLTIHVGTLFVENAPLIFLKNAPRLGKGSFLLFLDQSLLLLEQASSSVH
jgi:hypothetical protein